MSRTPGRTAYTIGAGVPFVDALAAGIRHRAGDQPEALARVRILLPTRRACRSLGEAFGRLSDGAALLLPTMTPLGDVDEDELAFAGWEDADAGAAGLDLPPAISGLRRQMLLAALVLANKQQPTTPEQAARLASELGQLLDQMHLERLGFGGLADLVPDAFADHWQITLRFLSILTDLWPGVLAGEGCIDAADRRNRLLDAQAAAWRAAPPDGPVIAAGSTGSLPATAELLKVVAGLPQGMVVLPGLDRTMDAQTREGLAPSHPQYGMARLLAHLEIDPDAVADWPAPGIGGNAEPARIQTIAHALHPGGRGDTSGNSLPPLSLPGVSYAECPGPRQEAGVIALALREALETEGRRAALVTPDRGLARRVQGELARWGISVDDSAGTPLAKTPPGAFLRLIAAMIAEDMAPVPLLAALKHPLAAGGMAPAAFRAQTRRLEVAVLRGPRPAPGGSGLLDAVRRAEHPKGKAKEALLEWTRHLAALAEPLADAMARPSVPFAELLAAHVALAEALSAEAGAADGDGGGGARLWAGEAGQAAAGFVAEAAEAANRFPPIRGRDYPALLDALMAGRVVRSPYGGHPRLAIWGLLEARLQHADLVILGGLNEGTWPPRADTGPWMSRPMRTDMGLPLPERRIGLAAHDFVQALGAPEVLMTRATRVEGAPTLPCRWLLRLETLLKAAGAGGGLAKADHYARWLTELDEPDVFKQPDRPAPKPPVEARPRELSVTRIETWVRDPYALYAEKILGLRPLEPLDADPAAAERGIMIHEALDVFLKAHLDHLPDDAPARLLEIGRQIFAAALSRPGVRAFWWPRFERIAHWFIGFEKERRAAGHVPIAPEAKGVLVLDGPAGPFTLTARADRIDRLGDGGLAILDYKTGAPPTWPQVECGLAPQLSLEAAIAAAGGFEGVGGETVRQIAYVRLSGGHLPGEMKPYRKDVTALAEKALEGLERRIAAFDQPDTPYAPRTAPMFISRFGDYDHLARLKEWSAGGGDGE